MKFHFPQSGPDVVRLTTQSAQLVTALALGYQIHGWTGALTAFLLLAVLVTVLVRYKLQNNGNIAQGGQLATALALGYLIYGWVGAVLGFVAFAVLIMLTVRSKMALAQKVGNEKRAARLASHTPWVNPNDPASSNHATN